MTAPAATVGAYHLADHPSKAWQVETVVLTEQRPIGSVSLARGEELFVIAQDQALLRPGYRGKDEVLVDGPAVGAGTWPVVLCRVRSAHAKEWAEFTSDDPRNRYLANRMLERVRAALARERGL